MTDDLYRYLSDAPTTGKARIPVGTFYYQDFRFDHWPEKYADIEFDLTAYGDDSLKLVAPGFGVISGDYGNGAIHVSGKEWRRVHQKHPCSMTPGYLPHEEGTT